MTTVPTRRDRHPHHRLTAVPELPHRADLSRRARTLATRWALTPQPAATHATDHRDLTAAIAALAADGEPATVWQPLLDTLRPLTDALDAEHEAVTR